MSNSMFKPQKVSKDISKGTLDEIEEYLEKHPDQRPKFTFMTASEIPGMYQRTGKSKPYYPFGLPGKVYKNQDQQWFDRFVIANRIRRVPDFGTKNLFELRMAFYNDLLKGYVAKGYTMVSTEVQAIYFLIDEARNENES